MFSLGQEVVYVSKAISSRTIFKKTFIPAWILCRRDRKCSLKLGNAGNLKIRASPGCKRGGDQEEPSQREGTHQHVYELKQLVIVTSKREVKSFY